VPAPTDADIEPVDRETTMCRHLPVCPGADAPDRDAARVVSGHPEQGWSLLCNGVVIFDDTGELLPDGKIVAPRRAYPAEHHVDHHRTTPRPTAA
jgi:hypothetical protein